MEARLYSYIDKKFIEMKKSNSTEKTFKKLLNIHEIEKLKNDLEEDHNFKIILIRKLKSLPVITRHHSECNAKISTFIDFMFDESFIPMIRWSDTPGSKTDGRVCLINYKFVLDLFQNAIAEEIDGVLKLPKTILQHFGFTFFPDLVKNNLKWHRIFCMIEVTGISIFFLLAEYSIVFSIKEIIAGDINYVFTALENVAVANVATQMYFKIYILFFRHREDLTKIIIKMKQNFPKSSLEQIQFGTKKYLNLIQFFFIGLVAYFFEMNAQYCSMPFLYKLYGWIYSINVPLKPVYSFILPFNNSNSLFYWTLSFIESWLGTVSVFIIASTDLLFASVANIAAMEFDNLSQKFEEITIIESEAVAIKKLKELVEIHKQIIEIAREINEIFSILFFANIFMSIFAICSFIFLTISGISNYFLLKYSAALIGMFMQIFIGCYFGDRLTESTLKVADGAYNSEWYKASPKYRKMILVIMMRAQKKKNISAWKFADINLNTFYWIMTTSYSYYSFLSSVYQP
ncbi:hypothetical protein PVAND_014669 [Polypedilum vanderplanki]|uniref:Odorant receptor n=1 Tax=Polypedilum vanderplanki TaxID=319348 RepID=A0A9J6BAD4_POLVA|nr:hypothetical protein PVAND_014669 [Polypedilum vanderplanki]